MTTDRQDAQGRAYAGSQLQTQIYVNRRPSELSEAVASAIGDTVDATAIEWRAPLENAGFEEPMDQSFLAALGLGEHGEALRAFWPSSGPRWDALAVAGEAVLLVEGKSYPAEMESSMKATAPESIRLIRESLAWAKGVLGADRRADWTTPYYQYANRLAHLCFLREEIGVPAWLVNLCFTDDQHHSTTLDAWKPALDHVRSELGFDSESIPHTVDVFLPARDRNQLTGTEE